LENILQQSSIETRNVINSLKEENSLSHKKVQESLNMQSKELNQNIKVAIESFHKTISNGIKVNNEQIIVFETKVTKSIVDLGSQTIQSFSNSNKRLIEKIEDSFGKHEVNLAGINCNLALITKDLKETNATNQNSINQTQEIFTANITSIKEIINDNNKTYKGNLDEMMNFVKRFEKNHNLLIENQDNLKETMINSFKTFETSVSTMKKSFGPFQSSVEILAEQLDDFVEGSKKTNERVISFIEESNQDMETAQKAYLDNSNEILKDLKNLHKTDEQLISKLLS
jgi:hypothetical protein